MVQQEKDSFSVQSKELLKENYVPSETERKRVVIYYCLIGILFALSNDKLSKYEYYHLKQAVGWWIVFFVVFVILSVFIFLPWLWIISWVGMLALIWIWIFFIIQGWQGRYTVQINWEKKVPFAVFAWLGYWLLELFNKKFEIKE